MSAKPCIVTLRLILTPMAAILASPTQTPVGFLSAVGRDAELSQCGDEDGFECVDVYQRPPAPSAEIDDRIPDELTGAVVGDLPSPVRPMYLDAESQKLPLSRENILLLPATAEGVDVRVLKEQQQIGQRSVDDLSMEPPLELERLRVVHDAEEGSHTLSCRLGDEHVNKKGARKEP